MPVVVRIFFLVLSLGEDFLEEEGFFLIVSAMMTSPLPVIEKICPAAFFPPLLLFFL